ncbi:MAG: beta strand repeat-containing protein [Phycisphaerae bacterium]
MLLSTIVGGQSFIYALPSADPTKPGHFVEVHANGNIVAELVAAVKSSDGSLVFGNLSGVLGNGFAEGNGSVPVTEGPVGSANPQPYDDPDTGLTISDTRNQIHLKGISSTSSGVTYAFNIFSQEPFPSNQTINYPTTTSNGNTSTTANNTLWDIQLLRIDNTTGKATFIADLTNQLETGGNNADPQNAIPALGPTFGPIPQGRAAFLPDLLNASNVTIGGAAFNPVDGRLYFDVEFKPPTSNANITNIVGGNLTHGVNGNVTLDILMSIDPTLANETAVISSLQYGNGVDLTNADTTLVDESEGQSRLDNAGGAYSISALTFQGLASNSATMWTYRVPAGTGSANTPPPNLESYSIPFTTNPVSGAIAPTGAFDVTEQGVPLTGVTGLAFIPSNSGAPAAQNGPFLWATSTTDASLHRIEIGNVINGGFRSSNWGTTRDLNTAGQVFGGNEGLNLEGLTWNAAVIDPFTETVGVLMSYDETTKDVVFISDTLRAQGTGQLFSVYTNQSDINASLTFQTWHPTNTLPFVSDLYSNNFTSDLGGLSNYAPALTSLGGNANNQVPDNVGQALLGYYDAHDLLIPGGTNFAGYLHQSGTLIGTVGILPSQYTTDPTGTPSPIMQPGLYVGYGLETPAAGGPDILSDLLGSDFVGVSALSVSNFGLITAVGHTSVGTDQLAFIDPNGTIQNATTYSVFDANGNPLSGIQGLAWGDVNLDGGQQLYAVYDLQNGNGPTLGTITVDFNNNRAVFIPFAPIGIGGGRIKALAFSNHETALDPNHQGLFAVADGGTAGPTDSLIQINPLTGAAFNPVGSQIITTAGLTVDTRSGVFDANGNFIIADLVTASLMDVSLTPVSGIVTAGSIVKTPVGSITATIGAIARNPIDNQFYAVDNETDSLTSGIGVTNSSILVKIKDFTNPLNEAVNFGNFLFDGTVTGRVFVSGSINKFYAGWLITGDSSAGFDPTANGLTFTDNFHVNGDIQHLLSLASIGTDGTQTSTRGRPRFFTGTEIIVGGKIGDLVSDDEVAAHVVVNNTINIPNIADANPLNPIPQNEDQEYVPLPPGGNNPDIAVRAAWGSGQLVWNTNQEAPFSNSNFNNAQYLGTIRNSVKGQPDVIHLQGQLWTANGSNGPDAADYFGISLLAGQSITVFLSAGALGIFDPDGRLVSTSFSFTGAGFNRQMTFTAAMAGTYRIAVSENSNFSTSGGALNSIGAVPYTLNIVGAGANGLGDLAIGGVVAGTNVLLNNAGTDGEGIRAFLGDIGAVVAGQVSSPFAGDAPAGGAARLGAGIGEGHAGGNGIANHNIMAPRTGFEFAAQSVITGYGNAAAPRMDIAVDNGNIRTLFAGSIGYSAINTTGVTVGSYNSAPDIYVPRGGVGLIETVGVAADGTTVDDTTGEAAPGDVLAVQFGVPAGGNIQHINATGGNIGGIFRTSRNIGVVNGRNMPYGTAATEFHAGINSNGGIIDLIDLTGDMGGNGAGTLTSGPAIETGPGGDVRFIHVLGNIRQDEIFPLSTTTTPGETRNNFFLHAPGPVTFTDDSGALVTLTPGFINGPSTIDPITGLTTGSTVPGQLSTRTYNIRGGGVVITDVQTNASLTVTTASAAGSAQPGEISNLEFAGTGIAFTTDSLTGLPIAPTNPRTSRLVVPPAGTPTFSTLTFTGGRTDVFDINNTGANAVFPVNPNDVVTTFAPNGGIVTPTNPGITVTPAYGVIDAIINNTGGDLINAELGDVGSISVGGGNIGSTFSNSGQQLVKTTAVFTGNNTFPFVDQRIGLTLGNVASVSAGKSIGNVTFTGVVGDITTDTLRNPVASQFYGINGPIVINGSVTPTGTTVTNANGTVTTTPPFTFPGATGPLPASVGTIDIGNGILSSGSGAGAHAGIFANGTIGAIIGKPDAVIRGTINSSTAIGPITITNGSIINAEISVTLAFNETGTFPTPITLPSFGSITENPFFNIQSISLPGNGGILSTLFEAANIGPISVPTGFGILESSFDTTQGTVSSITAGGYGFRDNVIQADNVGTITATGNGAIAQFASFNRNAQPTVYATYGGSSDVFYLTSVSDLRLAIVGDVFNGLVYLPPSPSGLTTGAIEQNYITGSGSLTSVSGYQLVNNLIQFGNAIGSVNIGRGGIDPVGIGGATPFSGGDLNNVISAGRLNSLTVAGNVQGLNLAIAGPVNSITISGSVLSPVVFNPITGTNGPMVSNFTAKGPSGDIGTFTVNGSFAGSLLADGTVGNITIGNRSARPGTDDFTGTISILDNHGAPIALNLLNLFGSIVGGTLNIFGNVGTINVFRSLDVTASNLVIHGNLSNISIGTDTSHNNYNLTGNLVVEGNLGTATVNGALNGLLLVKGNAQNVIVRSGRRGDVVGSAGGVEAEGVVTSFTSTGGNVAGNIVGTNGVSHVSISGGSLTGRVSSTFGNVSDVTITGQLAGTVSALNGTVTKLNLGGALTGRLEANTINSLLIPGNVSGTINVTNQANAITISGALLASGVIQAGWISTLQISGNDLGNITSGPGVGAPTKFTVGGNLGGKVSFSTPLSATIAHDITASGALTTTSSLLGLNVTGAIRGDVLADGQIGTIKANAISNAVITGGFGINAITAPGGITSSIIQAGIARGDDQVMGTNDINETPSMADIGSITTGTIRNSIIAAGGNIGTLRSSTMSYSSASSGLVLASSSIARVMADPSPLATTTELNAARANATLLHGNFTNAIVGGSGLINSALTAGVSPGADGAFNYGHGTSDDNINSSLTGGASSFGTVSTSVDANSVVLAATGGGQGTRQRVLRYTLDSNPLTSIVPNDPVTGTPVATATVGSPGTFSLNGQTITVTITGGAGATVTMYDNSATTGVLDTLVINGGSTGAPVSVSITTTAVGFLDIGRVLATDGTNVTSFTYNGYLVGDGSAGPQLWINSDIQTFSVGGYGTNGAIPTTWSGVIGGNVKSFFVGTQGTGTLRVGGTITNATIGTSVGESGTVILGHANPAQVGAITQIALDPTTNTTYAYSGGFIFPISIPTGAIVPQPALHTAFTNQPLTISGMDFSGTGTLYGVATLNNLNPTRTVGSVSTGDNLHALAVSSSGQLFAVNTNAAGVDQLVSIDPATGAMSTIGTLKDPFGHNYSSNFLALAFGGDTLYGIVNDVDGTGLTASTGMALVKIDTTADSSTGVVNVSNPSSSPNAAPGALIKIAGNTVTDPYDALVYGGSVAGNPFFYAVRRVGNVDVLDKISITNFTVPSSLAATATPVGNIIVNNGTTVTHIVGMGYDEFGHLVGMDLNGGGTSDLVGINTATPGASVYVSAPGSIPNNLSAFAFSPLGANFQTFAYSTNATTGGTLYVNPGTVASLGTIVPGTGTFTLIRALADDAAGTPIAGNVNSIAVTKSGNADIFVITDKGVLAEYDQFGNLVTGQPLGTVTDAITGEQLSINRLAFDNAGHLIGVDATRNRLVVISTSPTTQTINGQSLNVVLGSQLTGTGTVSSADLVGFEFSPAAGVFVGFDGANSNFIGILSTTPSALGGLTANSISTLNIASPSYGGRIQATGSAGFGAITATGGGNFTGTITTPGSIGSFVRAGTFSGTLVTTGSIGAIQINGNVGVGGVISVDGTASSVVIFGNLAGAVVLGRAGTVAIGSIAPTGVLDIRRDTSAVNVAGTAAGRISLDSVNSLRVGGLLLSGATVKVDGDAGSLSFDSGENQGASVTARGNVGNLTVGGITSGVIAVRGNVANATFNTFVSGVFAAGGNINSLVVFGGVNRSVITSGVWVGNDGVYNTADDVIYGGSIGSAIFRGNFNNSALLAGLLPRLGTAVNGPNNIPATNLAYIGNKGAANIEDVDSAEAGGIQGSYISNVTFPGGIDPVGGSVVVAADGVIGVTPLVNLQQRVLNNPSGATTIIGLAQISDHEIDVGFSKAINTTSINSTNFQLSDQAGNVLPGLSFQYYTQTLGDGSIQGIVRIITSSVIPTPVVNVRIANIVDRVGPRSALNDFNQDGVVTGNPFAPAFTTVVTSLITA